MSGNSANLALPELGGYSAAGAIKFPKARIRTLAESPQSQATATLPAAPSGRGTSFHPVPLQSVQFSSAIS